MATARTLTPEDFKHPKPIYCVWETTLRCDHACSHCGSRAGRSRPDELSTEELLSVADSLIRIGTREVTLIGGEAYLREDIYELTTYLAKAGIRVTMQTGGRGLTLQRCHDLRSAGMAAIGVSVDGPAAIHDRLRNSPGSHAAAMQALANAQAAGFVTTSNIQVNRLNHEHLRETAAELKARNVAIWRAQLTVPMGRAADRPDWIMQPYMIPGVLDTLAAIQAEAVEDARANNLPLKRAFCVLLGNNLGYFGPHEQVLRSRPGGSDVHWHGCQAGRFVLGIESDGIVKGCPSLPTAPYTGGNIRDVTLEQIWNHTEELSFIRNRNQDELWGRCKSCYYADVCGAGCSFTAHCTLGRRGNNPFCYHRATVLAREGLRERLVHRDAPAGDPYDFGRFEVIEEPLPETPERRTQLPVLAG
ncbi:MAG: radical SAM protein [Nannocystaceae bacterium]